MSAGMSSKKSAAVGKERNEVLENIIICPVKPEHIQEIAELEKLCFSCPWSEDMLKTQLNDGHMFFAALIEGKPVGYIGLMYVLDEGYISNVAVSPEYQRLGIGDMLLIELESRCREKQLSFMTLEVRESNKAAIRLYEKHGFTQVGLRKNYYDKPKENAILMTQELR